MPSGGKYHDGTNDHCEDCADEDSIQSSAGSAIDHHCLLSGLPPPPHGHHANQKSDCKGLQGHLPGPPTDPIQGHARVAGSFDCLVDALARCAKEIGGLIEGRSGERISARFGSV
jgi:hypothetical protein